jgi:putative endopeptidase
MINRSFIKIISMRFYFPIPVLLLMLAACHSPEKNTAPDFLAENIDTTISPATDFFDYANGGWIKKNPIPADQSSWGIGEMVQDDIYNRLKTINEKAASAQSAPGSIEQKIGDFWTSGMDTSAIEKQGLQPLQAELAKIDQIKNVKDLLAETALLQRKGIGVLMKENVDQDEKKSDEMTFHIAQGGLGMPDRDYYFNTDEKTVKVRQAFQLYLFQSFRTLGKDTAEAIRDADGVFQLEARLAKASRKLAALRDPDSNYTKMSVATMQKRYSGVDWKEYFKNSGIANIDSTVVGQPEFLLALNHELTATNLGDWKNYLSFHLLSSSAPYMDTAIFNQRFNYGRTLSGVKIPKVRWKRVLDAEERAMGEAVGQIFVKEYFPEKSKQRYNDMVEAIRDAYKERILHLTWMSDSTKQKALLKLSRITKKVGYPDKWRDFSALIIDRGPYVLNVQRAAEWWFNYGINKLGKPVDRTEWDMSPQTYNAYYNPSNNEIVLPAGIFMVPGKRDEDLDDAFVYGYAAASTIGHEITHGFDDQGRKFDDAGNLRNWWQPGDIRQFNASTKRIVAQFNNFIPVDSLHVNGEATQGENIADLGGVLLGWDAFSKTEAFKKGETIGGLTPAQRYFLGYAYGWMYSERKELLASSLMVDVHAPAKERVNGPMANIPAFYEAFGVKPGDKMYMPDSLRVSIW